MQFVVVAAGGSAKIDDERQYALGGFSQPQCARVSWQNR
jgi:hypothetical protein